MTQTSSPQRWKFVLVGAMLASGLSAGLLLIRGLSDDASFNWRWAVDDLINEGVTYAYVTGTTFSAGLVLGWLIGSKTDRLQVISVTDPLTQIANRRGFLTVFNDELNRALRYRTALAVLLVDVDNLKLVNDKHGHGAGDLALRTVAESLRTSCRASDLAARYGGDEFAILVPSTNAMEAQELANRVRHVLAREVTAHPELEGITVSVGISDLNTVSTPRVDALLASADAALYNAKAAGRDRIVIAPAKQFATAQQAVCA